MKLNLYILIDEENKQLCNSKCLFLSMGECTLFNEVLEIVSLSNNHKLVSTESYIRCSTCMRI